MRKNTRKGFILNLELYDLVIRVYKMGNKHSIKNVNSIHYQELELRREIRPHTYVVSPVHCGVITQCECSTKRCPGELINSRNIPFCYKLFGIKIPEEYLKPGYLYIITDRNPVKEEKYKW
jgi:hypothetical protein